MTTAIIVAIATAAISFPILWYLPWLMAMTDDPLDHWEDHHFQSAAEWEAQMEMLKSEGRDVP